MGVAGERFMSCVAMMLPVCSLVVALPSSLRVFSSSPMGWAASAASGRNAGRPGRGESSASSPSSPSRYRSRRDPPGSREGSLDLLSAPICGLPKCQEVQCRRI